MWSYLGKLSVKDGLNYIIKRSLKTKYSIVHRLDHSKQQTDQILFHIRVLDKLLASVGTNNSLLYKDKYKDKPQRICGRDYTRMDYVIQNYLKSLELDNALNSECKRLPSQDKLGIITLQLLKECGSDKFYPLVPYLVSNLLTTYNKYPFKDTLYGITLALKVVSDTLSENKLLIQKPTIISSLVDSLTISVANRKTIKDVLQKLDYKLYSDDIVRVVSGKKIYDEIEVTKGWRFLFGIINTNEAYLRSLGFPKQKLISIQKPMLVLICDGYLQSARQILPSITYMNKIEKSLLLLVSGECSGEALAAISINNNKNKRNGKPMRIIVMKYNPKDNNNISLHENFPLLKFLKLPQGIDSIYSCDYSDIVPSTVSASQYFGEIESFKASTGEALLYNEILPTEEIIDKHLHTTIKVNVGGTTELEIDTRRNLLEHLINDILCDGLASGFVGGYGVSLVKTIPKVLNLLEWKKCRENFNIRVGVDAVLNCLSTPMERALQNEYGINKQQVSKFVSKTMEIKDPNTAYLPLITNSESEEKFKNDLLSKGFLEPWNQINNALITTTNFLQLFGNCSTMITSVMEKPKK